MCVCFFFCHQVYCSVIFCKTQCSTLAVCICSVIYSCSLIFIFSMFHAELPGSPSHVSILVTSTSSLFVTIKEPEGDMVGLITRYRGRERTRQEDFHGGLVEWMGR